MTQTTIKCVALYDVSEGILVTVRFNKLVRPGAAAILHETTASLRMLLDEDTAKLVFLSHKTGDRSAEEEAQYISAEHGVQVYMAEWDDDVSGDTTELPNYIMKAIESSDGFLVHVIPRVVISMWIGYEIGGAHAMGKIRAKTMYRHVYGLPSVVGALPTLRDRTQLDRWIVTHIL